MAEEKKKRTAKKQAVPAPELTEKKAPEWEELYRLAKKKAGGFRKI
ncbi:hypothetical protein [Metabacillus sp. RGM 3146]